MKILLQKCHLIQNERLSSTSNWFLCVPHGFPLIDFDPRHWQMRLFTTFHMDNFVCGVHTHIQTPISLSISLSLKYSKKLVSRHEIAYLICFYCRFKINGNITSTKQQQRQKMLAPKWFPEEEVDYERTFIKTSSFTWLYFENSRNKWCAVTQIHHTRTSLYVHVCDSTVEI